MARDVFWVSSSAWQLWEQENFTTLPRQSDLYVEASGRLSVDSMGE